MDIQQIKMHLVEYRAKPIHSLESNEKQIIPSNTRISHQNESKLIATNNNKLSQKLRLKQAFFLSLALAAIVLLLKSLSLKKLNATFTIPKHR